MRKFAQTACCIVGSIMIGFFANRLDTLTGSLLFALGVMILVFSIVFIANKK